MPAPTVQAHPGVTARAIRVFVCDDYTNIRELIKELLHSERDISVVAEACDADELLAQISTVLPDVLVIDGSTQRKSPDVIIDALGASPSSAVVVYTVEADRAYVGQAFKCGARGYVLKDSDCRELTAAIRATQTGETYLDARLRQDSVRAISARVRTDWR